MDTPIFLNSSGGIISPHSRSSDYIQPFTIAPYVEQVPIPQLAVDSAAVYGDHPENLVTLTVSSGGALTFFVDSVAGGNDASGDGSYDNPWRSLKTAAAFLSCAQCTLKAAAKYIQFKVKGTVDYLTSWGGYSWPINSKLILTGWDGRCDMGSARCYGRYFFNLRVSAYSGDLAIYSDCAVVGGGGSQHVAIDCDTGDYIGASVAYNCSGAIASARVIYGGQFVGTNTYGNFAQYAYGATIRAIFTTSTWNDRTAFAIRSGAASLTVSGAAIAPSGTDDARITALSAYAGAYLGDCRISATAAVPSGGGQGVAAAVAVSGTPVVAGGEVYASAFASAEGSMWLTSATAYAVGLPQSATAAGVAVTVGATARAVNTDIVSSRVQEIESETLGNLGNVCSYYRQRWISGGVVYSTYTSSGGVCP